MFGQQEWFSKAAVVLTAIPTFDGDCDHDCGGDDCDGDDDSDDCDDEYDDEAINRSASTGLIRQ